MYVYDIDTWGVYNMEEVKNIISDAQKAAQKKYDQKTKMVSIKYTLSEMDEYNKLENYLNRTGQSKNGFIKGLINNFFESGQDQKTIEEKEITHLQKRRRRQEEYYPYYYVSSDGIQFVYDKLGENIADKILNDYEEIIKSEIENVLEEKGDEFDEWVGGLEERMNGKEFQDNSVEEICNELKDEMYNIF